MLISNNVTKPFFKLFRTHLYLLPFYSHATSNVFSSFFWWCIWWILCFSKICFSIKLFYLLFHLVDSFLFIIDRIFNLEIEIFNAFI
jgi:hypothetical protein